MNRKSALKVWESGGNVAGKKVCFIRANPATGKVQPVFTGNTRFQAPNSKEAPKAKLPNEDYQSFGLHAIMHTCNKVG